MQVPMKPLVGQILTVGTGPCQLMPLKSPHFHSPLGYLNFMKEGVEDGRRELS